MVVGGGYVAVELSHFFSQMGTEVVVVGHGDVLVDGEDPDVARRLTEAYRRKHELHLGYRVTAIKETDSRKRIRAEGDGGEVLGCHVVGPEASTVIHEVSTAVAAGADASTIAETIHVHPALSEVVQGAFRDVREVTPMGI